LARDRGITHPRGNRSRRDVCGAAEEAQRITESCPFNSMISPSLN